ncbi:MAG: hypothetical protein ACYSTZ_13130 [Planctomycetota bacterium]
MNGRKNLDTVLAICVFLAALAGPVTGRTIYVDPNGSADFTTIQAAIEDANDYDDIEVAHGIELIGRNLRQRRGCKHHLRGF